MRKSLFLLCLCCASWVTAQTPYLGVGSVVLTQDAFEYAYRMAQRRDETLTRESFSKDALRRLLYESEARTEGLDTTALFKAAYQTAAYRAAVRCERISEPYLNASFSNQFQERLAEIRFPLRENPRSVDTLRAYEEGMRLRETIQRGLSFEEAARIYSQDRTGNPLPVEISSVDPLTEDPLFEQMVAQTGVGEITPLFRTPYGYHLIKVLERGVPARRIACAHILIALSPAASKQEQETAKARIEQLYALLNEGADFSAVATQHSDDSFSASKGGVLPVLSVEEMDADFMREIALLEEGVPYTPPFCTRYGWHIVKPIRIEAGTLSEGESSQQEDFRGRGSARWFSGASQRDILHKIDSLSVSNASFGEEMRRIESDLLVQLFSIERQYKQREPNAEELQSFYRKERQRYKTPAAFGGIVVGCKEKKTLKSLRKLLKKNKSDAWGEILKNYQEQHGADEFVYAFGLFYEGENRWVDYACFKHKQDMPYRYWYSSGKKQSTQLTPFESVAEKVASDWKTAQEEEWILRQLTHYKVLSPF